MPMSSASSGRFFRRGSGPDPWVRNKGFPFSTRAPAVLRGLPETKQAKTPESISCPRAWFSSGYQLRIRLIDGRCLPFRHVLEIEIGVLRQRQAQIASIEVEHHSLADKVFESILDPRTISELGGDVSRRTRLGAEFIKIGRQFAIREHLLLPLPAIKDRDRRQRFPIFKIRTVRLLPQRLPRPHSAEQFLVHLITDRVCHLVIEVIGDAAEIETLRENVLVTLRRNQTGDRLRIRLGI